MITKFSDVYDANLKVYEGFNFGDQTIKDIRIVECLFEDCDFSRVVFNNCDVSDVVFDGCDMTGVEFNSCWMDSTRFKNTRNNVSMKHCVGENMVLMSHHGDIVMSDCNFQSLYLEGSNAKLTMQNVKARECTFVRMDAGGSSFLDCDLSKSYMKNCSLRESSFKDVVAEGGKWIEVDLRDSDVHETSFKMADFTHSNLAGLSYKSVNIMGAVFPLSTLFGDEQANGLAWSYGRHRDNNGNPVLMFHKGFRELTRAQVVINWDGEKDAASKIAHINLLALGYIKDAMYG